MALPFFVRLLPPALLLFGLGGCAGWRVDHAARAATGFASHVICDDAFVGGRDPDLAFAERVAPLRGMGLVNWALRRQVESLLAHSLDVALLERDGLALVDEPPRTHRYSFAGGEKMERGQAVARGCARVVIRTLRNWLMSVPVPRTEGAPTCPDPYALQARP